MSEKEIQELIGKADELLVNNELEKAKTLFARACQLDPDNAEAWLSVGTIDIDLKNVGAAIICLTQVVRLQPGWSDVHMLLASLHLEEGDMHESHSCCRRAIEADKNCVDAWMLLSGLSGLAGQFDVAENCASHVIRILPKHAEAHMNLANALAAQGKIQSAIGSYREALRLDPDSQQVLYNLGTTYKEADKYQKAAECFQQAIDLNNRYAEAHIGLGTVYLYLNNVSSARRCFEQARDIDPSAPESILAQIRILILEGEHEEAYRLLRPLLDASPPYVGAISAFADICHYFNKRPETVALIESILSSNNLSLCYRRRMLFAFGRLLDQSGNFDAAFEKILQANRLKSADFNAADHARIVHDLTGTFSAEFFDTAPRARNRSGRPVFIIGMPRSGTTLVEHILSSHPLVHGAGEMTEVPQIVASIPGFLSSKSPYPICIAEVTQENIDYMAEQYLSRISKTSDNAIRVLDKLPGNFMHLGLIELLFPDARIIHCTRNPLDTCLSCYFQDFGGRHTYAYDLENLSHYYQQYRLLMSHWKATLGLPILEVNYEKLVRDQEQTSRTMVGFLGLEWDERCLRYYESDRVVLTASSQQVRKPVYTRSVDQWKNYSRHIGVLMSAFPEYAKG